MNKTNIALFLVVVLLGVGGVHLVLRNSDLSEKIAADSAECKLRLAQFETESQQEVDDLRNFLLSNYNYKETDKPVETKKTKTTKFTQFLSHGHRIRAVESKYEFILTTALIEEAEKVQLRKVLTERERLVSLIKSQQMVEDAQIDTSALEEELAETEAQIQIILQDEVDYIRYLTLRERDL